MKGPPDRLSYFITANSSSTGDEEDEKYVSLIVGYIIAKYPKLLGSFLGMICHTTYYEDEVFLDLYVDTDIPRSAIASLYDAAKTFHPSPAEVNIEVYVFDKDKGKGTSRNFRPPYYLRNEVWHAPSGEDAGLILEKNGLLPIQEK